MRECGVVLTEAVGAVGVAELVHHLVVDLRAHTRHEP